jgi:hydroxypyruvate isomerase
MLFNELDFADRIAAAAKAGFKGVEYLFPYAYRKELLAELLGRHGLVQVLHNLPAGDWTRGERGIACLPHRQKEFRDGVGEAIEYATALGCRQVNCLAGITPRSYAVEEVRDTLVANLRFAATELGKAGIRLLIEPINTRDIPGFYLCRTGQALALIDEVGSGNLFLQYDIYHMQVMEGDLAHTLEANLPRIAHVQLADNPGRNEPGTGEINYPFLFRHLDHIGYGGWIGCEYKPRGATVAGLGWLREFSS